MAAGYIIDIIVEKHYNMKRLLYIILLCPLISLAQYTYQTGAVVGNQTVITVPVASPAYGTSAQALIYYPDDYFQAKNANKKYPLFVFLHGAGEGKSNNIAEVNNTSLPDLIAHQGLKPYGIDPATGDTIKFIVVSPHCASCGGSYSYPQLQYAIPYILSTYHVDPSCVWVGGLSSGGSCTWSVAMADTAFASKLAGILVMANGGWDQNLAAYAQKLAYNAQHGLACLYTIGDQDPGYNAAGFFAYQSLMKTYAQKGRYVDSVIKGGTHGINVWTPPFYLTSRIWSPTVNAWSQMWTLRRNAVVIKPPPSIPHAVISLDSSIINYPNSVVHLSAAGSYATNGKIVDTDWTQDMGDSRIIMSASDSGGICVSGLRPGNYRFKLVVTDSLGNKDSTYASVVLNGVVIPVCPPQRSVTAIEVTINGILFTIPLVGTKISYSDGTTQ